MSADPLRLALEALTKVDQRRSVGNFIGLINDALERDDAIRAALAAPVEADAGLTTDELDAAWRRLTEAAAEPNISAARYYAIFREHRPLIEAAILALSRPSGSIDAERLRQLFRDNGWSIRMDDRAGQPLDPFAVIARLTDEIEAAG